MIRHPAVAGSFYPAQPQQLHRMLERLLIDARTVGIVPKALIVPHAGYIYSGPIAASAYALLKSVKDKIDRVVIIGPAHRVAFRGLAVSSAESFATPLGVLNIDLEAVKSIVSLPFVEYLDQAHAFEHSVEVQLPFLQETLAQFQIVPIVAGDASPEQVSQVIDLLWGSEETLIVISSDLSHYHDYAAATKLDRATTEQIERMAYEQLTYESACGKVPVSGLLKSARQKHLSIKTLDVRNSGDTSGDKSRVVGYGAYVIEQRA